MDMFPPWSLHRAQCAMGGKLNAGNVLEEVTADDFAGEFHDLQRGQHVAPAKFR